MLRRSLIPAVALSLTTLVAGCASPVQGGRPIAIGIESQYADVISQIAGPYVEVRAIETNPNTDPHQFEASPAVARAIASASLVVENGLGYDPWAARMIAAEPSARRKVIDVQRLLGLPAIANPHVWYDPGTMPAVAAAVAAALSSLQPAQAAYFQANVRKFDASLVPWTEALAAFKRRYPRTPVAVTEPVADELLTAAGCSILTPHSLQIAIMNGVDPAPQDVAAENALLREHRVKVLVYNRQVTSALTDSFLELARRSGIPVVGVYETLPAGYDYQSWMQAELAALVRAVSRGVSTETLGRGAAHP
jgi:zinc/manganese transport system substrate-binding protein